MNVGKEHFDKAEDWLRQAIQTDEKDKMKWFLAGDHVVLSDLHERKGEKSKAEENLQTAINIFKQCGADGWVRRIERQLTMPPIPHDTR